MRKEPGPINARIAAIVNESGSGERGSGVRRRVEGERDVVGERVARVVGGLQQQELQQQHQRLTLTVSVLGLPCVVGSGSGNETGVEEVRISEVTGVGGGVRRPGGSTAESVDVSSLATVASPSSVVVPPWSPSPSPSPTSSPVSSRSPVSRAAVTQSLSKFRKRVTDSRSKLSLYWFHGKWWQRCVLDRLLTYVDQSRLRVRVCRRVKRNKKYYNPRDHIISSCSRRLQRINQRIKIITKKHQILRYDRIAEKYLHWENHLREQMMIRRWGAKKNVELDRDRKSDMAKLECLRKRRDALVKMISAKGL